MSLSYQLYPGAASLAVDSPNYFERQIYNFDETGFAVSLIATAKVVIKAAADSQQPPLKLVNRRESNLDAFDRPA